MIGSFVVHRTNSAAAKYFYRGRRYLQPGACDTSRTGSGMCLIVTAMVELMYKVRHSSAHDAVAALANGRLGMARKRYIPPGPAGEGNKSQLREPRGGHASSEAAMCPKHTRMRSHAALLSANAHQQPSQLRPPLET